MHVKYFLILHHGGTLFYIFQNPKAVCLCLFKLILKFQCYLKHFEFTVTKKLIQSGSCWMHDSEWFENGGSSIM